MPGTAIDVEGGFPKDATPDSSTPKSTSGSSDGLATKKSGKTGLKASLSTAFLSSGMPVAFKVRALIIVGFIDAKSVLLFM
jgi:hypothetical protein